MMFGASDHRSLAHQDVRTTFEYFRVENSKQHCFAVRRSSMALQFFSSCFRAGARHTAPENVSVSIQDRIANGDLDAAMAGT